MTNIKLGYMIPTGEEVDIPHSHLIVCGVTQLSGKTSTLQALIKRSHLKAIVFKTKIGEKSFTGGFEIPPFFKDRSDYEFVKSLIEAYSKERLVIEKGTLMELCKGATSLADIKRRVDLSLQNTKIRGLNKEIHVRLQHYLEELIPQIQQAHLSRILSLYSGINIMNLEKLSGEAQSLIIQAVLDEVLRNHQDVIIVIPEAWKFIPQRYNNPCKRSVESFIRQGAANNNYIWIDSQDMAGVDKIPLKQISSWCLGYQSERNEVKHTLDQIPLPSEYKPSEYEIMTLRIGQFYLATTDGVKKVYVQPTWVDNATAIRIAKGEISVDTVKLTNGVVPGQDPVQSQEILPSPSLDDITILRKEINDLRREFISKFQELEKDCNVLASHMYSIENEQPKLNKAEIIKEIIEILLTRKTKGKTNGSGNDDISWMRT